MSKRWAIFAGCSLMVHGVFAFWMYATDPPKPPPKQTSVKIKVTKKEVEPPKPKPPKPIPPKPKRPKPKKKKVASERKPEKAPVKNAKPVQGVSTKSLSKGPANVAVPIGNTLMTEDKGIRLTADKVDAMEKDLSQDAVIIPDSIRKPEYSNDALDAGLEGIYRVEVFVDEEGEVVDAELETRIGYGMDARVVNAAKQVRFSPRRDRTGKAISGWTVVKFNLRIN